MTTTTTAAPATAQNTTGTRVITYSEAVREAIGQAMEVDDRVFMLGEDIGIYGGAFGVSGDLDNGSVRPDPRHPDLRARDRRCRRGCRDVRDASRRRDPVLRLHQPGDGPDRQPGRQDPLHARRRGQRAHGVARPRRLGHRRRGAALAVPGGLVRPRPRPEGGHARHRGRRQGSAAVGDRRPQPGHRDRAQTALPHQRRGTHEPVRTPLGKAAVRRHGDDITMVATGIMVSRSWRRPRHWPPGRRGDRHRLRAAGPVRRRDRARRGRAPAGSCWSRRRVKSGGFMSEIAARISESDAIYSLLAPIGRLCGLDVAHPLRARNWNGPPSRRSRTSSTAA